VFHLTYILHELRRRLGRTLLTAIGLALGVGLVIGIIGVSQGLDEAQASVLAPLKSVGTDVLVTRVAGATPAGATPTTVAGQAPGQGQQGPGGGFFIGGGGGPAGGPGGPNAVNQADTSALLAENQNVITDLAKLGKPGDKFTRDFFLSATLISFPQDAVAEVAKVPGVTAAVGGLVQLANHQTGTVPQIVAELQTGGETFTQTSRPDPMTDAERSAFQACVQSKGGNTGGGGPDGGPGGGGPGGGGGNRAAFEDCLPARFREFQATDIASQSYTAAGVDPANTKVGLVTDEQLSEGRWIAKGAPNEILLNAAYANTKALQLGAKIPINGTDFTVVGIVRPTLTGSTADIYFPLSTLQTLAGKAGRVTQVLVKTDNAESLGAVTAKIKALLPGAEVVTTKGLADQVTGSLADAKKLANRLGGALAVIVLVAAFSIAALLTLSSIGKRVREIGTLRAIGWSKGRVVRQLLGETAGIGLLGGVLGLGVGAAVAAGVQAFSPSLSASSAGVPGAASSNLSRLFGQTTTALQTTQVTLHAPLHPTTLLLGVGMALVGGLLAGLVGGLRAARLRPAVALRDFG
jgi:putative ABC transport system permease protein